MTQLIPHAQDLIELNTLSHVKARELVASGAPVYVPVNPVEYHGPHLPLYNDYLLSLASAYDLHARLRERGNDWPFIVGAALHMGVDPVPGHGSLPFSFVQTRAAVLKACQGLEALGAKKVVFTTFHGAPLHGMAIQAGVDYLNARGIRGIAPFNIVLQAMLEYRAEEFARAFEPIADLALRGHVSENLYKDFHGGFFETSIALHYLPKAVDPIYKTLPPCPPIRPNVPFELLSRLAQLFGAGRLAAECRFAAYGLGWLKVEPFPGYTGWPHLASAEAGKAFAEVIMSRYVESTEAVFAERAPVPRPIMPWLYVLSLGGRLQPH